MRIELSQAVLRPWRQDDAASLVQQANNRRVAHNLRDAFPHPYTAEDATNWVAIANVAEPLRHFAIAVDGAAVGGIGLVIKDDVHRRSAEVGYWLGEAYWGRGIATEALRAISDYAFATFDLIRLFAGVFDWNPASARVLEKAGFEFEARHRRAITKGDRTGDELLYVLLRDN